MVFRKYFLFILLLPNYFAHAYVRDYQTTRMISTSGAGTASILMVDALYLNPATSAFFNDSLFYAQQNSGELKFPNSARTSSDAFSDPKGLMLAVTDGSTKSKGAGAYNSYEEGQTERTRYSFNLSSRTSPSTSIGLSYHYTQDQNKINGSEDKFHRIDLGFLAFQNQDLSYGLTIKDISNADESKTLATTGLQYVASKNVVALLDLGFDYTSSVSGSFFYKVAAQVKFLKDLSFRLGFFDDKSQNLKGGSWGVHWNGPRLSLEFALKKSRLRDQINTYLYNDEKITDMSFSLIVKI